MAALTHLGLALAAKPAAPRIPLALLVASAYAIDLIWGVFYLAGVEQMPGPGVTTANPWSHGLFMAAVWSLLAGLLAGGLSGTRRTGLFISILVFSHWIIDFISHPMTAVFPHDMGLPIFFASEPLVGLGLWSTPLGVAVGEYGVLALGLLIYLITLVQWRKHRTAQPQT